MPLASMEKVTSICGMPRRARRMPVSRKRPSVLLQLAISRSPCSTWMSTEVWKLAAVVKYLTALHRQGGVAVDDPGEHVAHGLDAQRKGRYVQKQQPLDLSGQHARLQARAHGHAFVRVDVLAGLLARQPLDRRLHGGDAGGAAHQQHPAQIPRLTAPRPAKPAPPGQRWPPPDGRSARRTSPGSGRFPDAWRRPARRSGRAGSRWWSWPRSARSWPFPPLPGCGSWPSASPVRSICSAAARNSSRQDNPLDTHCVEVVAAQPVVPRRGQHFHHVRRRCPEWTRRRCRRPGRTP